MKIMSKLFDYLFNRKNGEFPYIYVEIDGSIRELDDEEKNYLTQEFHPNDGARSYIKRSYNQLTPDNKIDGFLRRSKIPKDKK